jgi:hypothetical protein
VWLPELGDYSGALATSPIFATKPENLQLLQGIGKDSSEFGLVDKF